ncbi:MAG: hypothetical protein RIF41_34700, partial [Polyangiaceae bacterium]
MTALPRHLLPDNAEVRDGRLFLGGVDVLALVEEHGTPLFVYDEDHLRARCREAKAAFGEGVSYATKAFLCKAMAKLAHEEGMHLDVASGGELYVALAAGVPAERLVLHGNNKLERELKMALDEGVGRIVIDSFDEIDRLERLVRERGGDAPKVLIRFTPGVEAHTHEFIQTGQKDSKFGFGVQSGAAAEAIERVQKSPCFDLVGLHCHIGSQVFAVDSFHKTIEVIAPIFVPLGLPELSIGGGLGVAYVEGESAPSITAWGEQVVAGCRAAGIDARVT